MTSDNKETFESYMKTIKEGYNIGLEFNLNEVLKELKQLHDKDMEYTNMMNRGLMKDKTFKDKLINQMKNEIKEKDKQISELKKDNKNWFLTVEDLQSKLILVDNKIKELQAEIFNNEEIIFDMLNQCCGNDDNNKIDNHCMSCYEQATEYLTKKGKLKKINKRMFKIKGGD